MGKRGPTPNGEYSGQTAVLSTRITQDLRVRLENEVKISGKTLSREIEHRLRRTFIDDDKISDAFGSKKNYALMRTIAMVLEFWHNPTDIKSDWTRDPVAFDQVCLKIKGVLEAMRPTGTGGELSDDDKALAEVSARSHPARVMLDLQCASNALPLNAPHRDKILSSIKKDLGNLIVNKFSSEEIDPEIKPKTSTSKKIKISVVDKKEQSK